MKFLCLAYGNESDWVVLSAEKQNELLAQDEVLRQRGDLVAVLGESTVVRAAESAPGPFAIGAAPLVGFSIIEASDTEEAVSLVAGTPCAVAGGAIEVRPIL